MLPGPDARPSQVLSDGVASFRIEEKWTARGLPGARRPVAVRAVADPGRRPPAPRAQPEDGAAGRAPSATRGTLIVFQKARPMSVRGEDTGLFAARGGGALRPRWRLTPAGRGVPRGGSLAQGVSCRVPPARAAAGSSAPLLPSEGRRSSDCTLNAVTETPCAALESHALTHTRWEHTLVYAWSGSELKSLLWESSGKKSGEKERKNAPRPPSLSRCLSNGASVIFCVKIAIAMCVLLPLSW